MLDEIRKRLSKATRGPWTVEVDSERIVMPGCFKRSYYFVMPHLFSDLGPQQMEVEEKANKDADFIAHAPEDIAYLLNLVDRARIIFGVALADCNSQGWDENPKWMTNAEQWLEDAK